MYLYIVHVYMYVTYEWCTCTCTRRQHLSAGFPCTCTHIRMCMCMCRCVKCVLWLYRLRVSTGTIPRSTWIKCPVKMTSFNSGAARPLLLLPARWTWPVRLPQSHVASVRPSTYQLSPAPPNSLKRVSVIGGEPLINIATVPLVI